MSPFLHCLVSILFMYYFRIIFGLLFVFFSFKTTLQEDGGGNHGANGAESPSQR